MSLIQRILQLHPEPVAPEPDAPPRFQYPHGVFAALVTDPPERADEAYAAFQAHHLTPGVAERYVAAVLKDVPCVCAPVEMLAPFRFDLARETTDQGRLRVFIHYLVQTQFVHESNARVMDALRERRARRVQIVPGCCEVCDEVAGRNYRLSRAPVLPVQGCSRHGGCVCAYAEVVD